MACARSAPEDALVNIVGWKVTTLFHSRVEEENPCYIRYRLSPSLNWCKLLVPITASHQTQQNNGIVPQGRTVWLLK